MSLTSFLKIPEVKAMFREEFPVKNTNTKLNGEMKAPPLTKNYTLVGTAFDYVLRFLLEHTNPTCKARQWVVEEFMHPKPDLTQSPRYGENFAGDMDAIMGKMELYLDDAKKRHTGYIERGVMDDGIFKTAIVLAQMEHAYRSRASDNFDTLLGSVDGGDIEDLCNLAAVVDVDKFHAKKACYLNPVFGDASILVGGADADLIVDDVLIDIKTTKNLSFRQDHYNQLIGYYVLSKLGMVNGTEEVAISRLGIYFSRHGLLHTVPVEDIENNPNFPKFVETFEKLALAKFSRAG